ncbi:MAG: glycosyltransferase [Flammeovirgaceae bacterium]|nr:glycosyltransferase [Flammeovirgaceae bacterium]
MKNKLDAIKNKNLPKISILIAVRNEENCIQDCLESLFQQNYPAELFEVIIGNDQSEDNSETIINDYIKNKPNFFLKNISTSIKEQKGKANVLAQIAHFAKGDLYCFTDADIEVEKSWLRELVNNISPKTGIITGFTTIKGKSFFEYAQAYDWTIALSLIKLATDLKIPVTTLGNNMLITKKAYQDVGGYENIPFSVTEDFEIFHQIVKKGWEFKQMKTKEILAASLPAESILQLLLQRKRWAKGAIRLPWFITLPLFLQLLFFPLFIFLFLFFPKLGLILLSFKILAQWFVIIRNYKLLQLKVNFFALGFYEIYNSFISMATLICLITPIKVVWKGRKY